MTKVNQDVGTTATSPFIAGDHKTLEITVLDEDNNDAPFNLNGATIKWQAFELDLQGAFVGSAVITKEIGDGITVTDAANGVFQVALVPADTIDLSGTFHHEAEVTDSGGRVATSTTGKLEITKGAIA